MKNCSTKIRNTVCQKCRQVSGRLLTLFACVIMAAPLMAQSFTVDGIIYNVTGANTVEVGDNSNHNGSAAIIPAQVSYNGTDYSVTSIGKKAFRYNRLISITIPNSITSIGESAFEGCRLTSVIIPNSVTEIGNKAFHGCITLISVVISNSVTLISDYAFDDCRSLTSVIISNSVTSIGNWAFRGCGLTSVTIPNSVTSIGNRTFYECEDLTCVNMSNSIISIGDYAFYDCRSLTSITIPNSATSIGNMAFNDCRNLTFVEVASNNPNYSSENGVLFNKNKTNLIQYPSGKLETSYIIPNSVTSIQESAFANCNRLTSIEVAPDSPNYNSEDGVLFNKDKIHLIQYPAGKSANFYIIPKSVTTIGYKAFYGCLSLTSISIPNSVITIEESAFAGCDGLGLISVTIPNSVTSIGSGAFANCSLTSVTIPSSVTSIGDGVFYDCTNLQTVTVNRTIPLSVTYGTFNNINLSECTLKAPAGSRDAYMAANIWKEFGTIVEIE